MIVVFQTISPVSFIPALITSVICQVYYLRVEGHWLKHRLFEKILYACNVRALPLAELKRMDGFRYWNCGFKDAVYGRVDKMLSNRMIDAFSAYFKRVDNIQEKIKISLATSFGYYDVGMVALYKNGENIDATIVFVHTQFLSFIKLSNGVKGAEEFIHLFLPSVDVENILNVLTRKVFKFLRVVGRSTNNVRVAPVARVDLPVKKKTAIFYHHSMNYGKLFLKSQYFSNNESSELHRSRVACFVLGRAGNSPEDAALTDMQRQQRVSDLLLCGRLILFNLRNVRTLSEVGGLIMLVGFHYSYLGWLRAVERYPHIENVIIDYDVLFPKMLALALETSGVRTIAMQERATTSFDYYDGVIADTFLLAGGLFTEYGIRNQSNSFRIAKNFGAWRTSLFWASDMPEFCRLSYVQFGEKRVDAFDSVICFLVWFTDYENPVASPLLCPAASQEFYARAKLLADNFPETAVVLRLKILNAEDEQAIRNYFSGTENLFLCDDYSKMAVSYALCKRANLIVSVFTSLVEESIAYGKKVILLNSSHNFVNICSDMYPPDFRFAMADNREHLLSLAKKCLSNDVELSSEYGQLRKKLSGDCDFSIEGSVTNALEKCLK